MLVRCPSCGSTIRLTDVEYKQKTTPYFCKQCDKIVHIDIVTDEIHTSSSVPRPQGFQHSSRVLVADDTVLFATQVEELLLSAGFLVTLAHDGMETLRKITEERPDILFLDLFMPRMSGFEVLKTLRTNPGYKNFRNLPVLVTSGVYKPAEVQILHDLGANGFISKDAVPQFLVYRLKRLLENPSGTGKFRLFQS